jgi:hypothetical protein
MRRNTMIAGVSILAAVVASVVPAMAAPAASLAGHIRTGAAAPGAHQLIMHRPGQSHPGAAGMVTGVVLEPGGGPAAGACVTVTGHATTESARTSPSGQYFLSGLPAGTYSLRFRSCTGRAAALQPSATSRAVVTGAQLSRIAPVRLRPARGMNTARPGAARSTMPAFVQPTTRRLYIGRLPAPRGPTAQLRLAHVAGRVTNAAGKPIKGICVWVQYSGFSVGTSTSATGTYRDEAFPGRPIVQFAPTCGIGGSPSAGNWAPQWYRGVYSAKAATPVTVRAGKTTWHIDAVMARGGKVSGIVTGKGGAKLSHVCVDLMTANGKGFVAQAKTVRGAYRFDALDPGRYRVFFDPACGYRTTPYLAQWWPNASGVKASKQINVALGRTTGNVNAALRLGGAIAGVVRAAGPHGAPLQGMCVAALRTAASVQAFANTRKDGTFRMEGLPAGRYTLVVNPGCNNHGNWLSYNSPRPFPVRLGQTTVVHVFLQPGAILTGTVTSAATGLPLRGICVSVNDSNFDGTRTGPNGTFYLDQITPGRFSVGFSGGCGNTGSYAPQWFPGRVHAYRAALVTLRGGQVTAGVNAKMQAGSDVAGTVTSANGGAPLRNICIGVAPPGQIGLFGFPFIPDNGQTRKDGSYLVQNLAAGQYQVVFFFCGFSFDPMPGWVTQMYRQRPEAAGGGLLDVPAAATVSSINARLARGGAISGNVSTPPGYPDGNFCVNAINVRTGEQAQAFGGSSPSGIPSGYNMDGLRPGSYKVFFYDCGGTGGTSQWYSHKATQAAANPVVVRAGRVSRHIGARLRKAGPGRGSISGRITSAQTGKPVAGTCVGAYLPLTFAFRSVRTDSHGDYTLRHLASGRYQVFGGCGGYAAQVRSVTVTSPHAIRGIDFAVSLAGSISGTVLAGKLTPAPQPGVCVTVQKAADPLVGGFAITGRGGQYVVGGLVPGRYLVYFDPVNCGDGGLGLAPQWFNGQTSQAAATPVTVLPGQATTGIGATLLHDGTIKGTVTTAASAPLAGICVEAAPVRGNPSPPVYTVSQSGNYSLTGLSPDSYRVIFTSGCGATGYAKQYWQNATSATAATVITVAPGSVTSGIDAAMHP